MLPKFLLAVEFTSLIQHVEELLIPQAAFEAFSISQKTDVKEAPGESFFLYAGTYYIVFGSYTWNQAASVLVVNLSLEIPVKEITCKCHEP